MKIAWYWMLGAFFSGGFLGAMVIALCAAAKRGDQAIGEMLRYERSRKMETAREETLATDRAATP